MPRISSLTALELAAEYRAGTLSPVDVVERIIQRVELINPSINALVGTSYERARMLAERAEATLEAHRRAVALREELLAGGLPVGEGEADDGRRSKPGRARGRGVAAGSDPAESAAAGGDVAAGLAAESVAAASAPVGALPPVPELPPLLGVPFVVSESLALAAMQHSSGSRYRSDRLAHDDATAVARVIEAGAIPLGVANTAELAFWIETDNGVYGRTASPWDSGRIAGGASGGVAVLVSAGCVPFGVGVDMTGSLRVSAHACGVVAHKPTGGLVPLTGLEPMPVGRMQRFTTVGPVARSVADLDVLLRLMAGPDGADGAAVELELGSVRAWDPMWKRVVLCEDFGFAGLSVRDETRRALRLAADVLTEHGAEVEVWQPRQLAESFSIWLSMVHEGYGLLNNFQDMVAEGERTGVLWDLVNWPIGRSRLTGPVLAMILAEKATKGSFLQIQRFAAEGRRLQQRIRTVLNGGGVLLAPVLSGLAPRHGRSLWRPRDVAHSAVFNVLELPSTAVSIAPARGRLPVAVQVVADHGRDDASLAAAALIERSLRPVPAPRLRRLRRA